VRYYPVAIKLDKKCAVVIGGGRVAERKVLGLLRSGAHITVVSPKITAALAGLEGERLKWNKRLARKSDLIGADIVIAATNVSRVNRNVSRWAEARRVLCNVVDKPRLGNFIAPAVLRKGKAILAVYTDGKDPVLSRDLKNFLKEHWNDFLRYRNRLQKNAD